MLPYRQLMIIYSYMQKMLKYGKKQETYCQERKRVNLDTKILIMIQEDHGCRVHVVLLKVVVKTQGFQSSCLQVEKLHLHQVIIGDSQNQL